MSLRCLMLILLLAATGAAPAAVIYKCRQAGDVISYQDEPCPGRQIGIIRTSPQSPAAAAAPAASPAGVQPESASSRTLSLPPRAPRPAFKCTRADGSVYFSGERAAYARLIDAPAGQSRPRLPTGVAAPPPGKAWAQDACIAATRQETCAYYKQQMAANDAALQTASGDAQRRLSREAQRLRAIHNHRCVR